jgi:aminoglycoside 3-N-acetyltransferase
MKTVTKKDILQGLKRLGIKKGDHILAHTAMGSFGKVAGGAETVIDALLETVGAEGTVMMPTFGPPSEIFDVKKSETNLGTVAKAFWKRKGAVRSRHPLAAVAVIGEKAKWLAAGHESEVLAHGENTPYVRLAEIGGKILLLGVDQDRSTFLHVAEALTNQPYLRASEGAYVDGSGKVQKKSWPFFPGPHRDFIGLQNWLESLWLVKKTRIGSCVAQVMPAAELLDALLKRIKDEPGLFISDNPNMYDAIWQRADILRAEFKKEAFALAADSLYAGRFLEEAIDNLKRFGIDNIVLSFVNATAWDRIGDKKRKWYLQGLAEAGINVAAIKVQRLDVRKAAALLKEARTKKLIVPSTVSKDEIIEAAAAGLDVYVENSGISGSEIVSMVKGTSVQVAFNPLNFVQVGENPFLGVYTRTHIVQHIGALYINDGLATCERTALEEGLGEIKELISILRCRSFDGLFILQGPSSGSFAQTAVKFIDMLKELGECPEK